MSDAERHERTIKAVHVACSNDGDEYHEDGLLDVTAITWGWASGSMAALSVVQVWKGDHLASEHPFINCLGVYYKEPTDD